MLSSERAMVLIVAYAEVRETVSGGVPQSQREHSFTGACQVQGHGDQSAGKRDDHHFRVVAVGAGVGASTFDSSTHLGGVQSY